MNKQGIIAGILIVAIIVVIVLVATSRGNNNEEIPQEEETEETEVVRINALHAFENGTHTIAGEVNLPTPCHILEATPEVSEDGSEVVVNFNAENQSEGDELCAQVLTPNPFKVSFEADEDAEISVTYEGEDAVINLLPREQEELDSFEVFIKG